MLLIVFGLLLKAVTANDVVARTAFGNGVVVARAPEPTAAPEYVPNLYRRDFTSVCGYIDNNASAPFLCDQEVCGYNTKISAFGCCTTTSGSFAEACRLQTVCYDSTAFVASCGPACQSNSLAGWCTHASYPYCDTIYLTGGAGAIFSTFQCTDLPSQTYNAVEYLSVVGGSVPYTSTSGSMNFAGSLSSPKSITTSSYTTASYTTSSLPPPSFVTGSVSSVPFTQVQQTAGSGTTQAVSSSSKAAAASGVDWSSSSQTMIALVIWFLEFL